MLTGCETISNTLVKTRIVVPEISAETFSCAHEVPIGNPQTEVQFAEYAEEQRLAGADCRARLVEAGETYNSLRQKALDKEKAP
jgi:hypothetical protein